MRYSERRTMAEAIAGTSQERMRDPLRELKKKL